MSGALFWGLAGGVGFAIGVILLVAGAIRCAAEAEERAEHVDYARSLEAPAEWEFPPRSHVKWCSCSNCESVAAFIAEGGYQ
jgi:hypothetical protein